MRQTVGLDFGMNFLVTAYDSHEHITFVLGRAVKERRAHFKIVRQTLQRRSTPSARSIHARVVGVLPAPTDGRI